MKSLSTNHGCAVNGTTVHWAEVGEGRPLVLLHGLSDSHLSWQQVGETLGRHRRVLMLDLPGHGLSGRPDASYDLDWHAATVGAWVDHIGLDDFDLFGHSYGGGVAQYVLLTHYERVRRLGLVAPGGLGREVAWSMRLLSLPGAEHFVAPFLGLGTRLVLRSLSSGTLSSQQCRWAGWANSAPGTARALARTTRGVIDLRGQHRHFLERAHEIPTLPPVAIYWGDKDPVLPIRHAHQSAEFIERVKLTTFPDCGHFPHLDNPAAFAAAMSEFLDDSAVRRARVVVGAMPPDRRSKIRRGFDSVVGNLRNMWRRLRGARPSPHVEPA